MSSGHFVKYKFSLEKALLAQQQLQFLEGKRYLDHSGQVKTVKRVIITPYDRELMLRFIKQSGLFSDHREMLHRYQVEFYAILIFIEAPNLYIDNITIEEFENQFGIHPQVIEMIVGLAE
ncbi:hypothetical protein WBG78_25025 [Chryseolinea sp. T2]|uniref:hypothetical protein n=1 Tax=Chryseolinea sp. T2 TaxID=3129255 RepID=UPI003076E7AF